MFVLLNLNSPIFYVLYLLLAFGAIALIAFLCRRYIPGLRNENKPIDETKVAEEELNRILEPMNEENVEVKKEEEKKDDGASEK